ncbi:hypothetical protein Cob_v006557 [Colletotrichum orbiculare MAFF 240422]|uniref:Uncharacterized protein n=1 Tax=Colletotrichum orbiculare (strain 104-T / ATCC 96160 / CBS 514.97 / LARS 414 / MAFF 240422) TaxID=1213857 RepID=A0A484FSJ9_COLOR|nr:hypothetical protein Cob_v006557 [Colletotrichum orbiculare MAFF 240422]
MQTPSNPTQAKPKGTSEKERAKKKMPVSVAIEVVRQPQRIAGYGMGHPSRPPATAPAMTGREAELRIVQRYQIGDFPAMDIWKTSPQHWGDEGLQLESGTDTCTQQEWLAAQEISSRRA